MGDGDNYVDPRLLARSAGLNYLRTRSAPIRKTPMVGRRHTSARRRGGGSLVQQASSLAMAINGNPAIDRHKPYVYGASPMKLRRQVISAVNDAIRAGLIPGHDQTRG